MGGPVIAIDGPAGAGKSTLARRLALELDLPYVNTGSMYRAITALALERGLNVEDEHALGELAREMDFGLDPTSRPRILTVQGRPPGEEILSPEVEASVSAVARHPAVRSAMVAEQRRLGRDGAVIEGRDIGSVVFPEAEVKIFLQAAVTERVTRRAIERGEEGKVGHQLRERDARDARVNPFVPAPGAIVIDTTGRHPDEVFSEALSQVRRVLGGAR